MGECWCIRRYRRILVPYLIIAGIVNILAVTRGRSIAEAVLSISQCSITPVHNWMCNKVKHPVQFTFVLSMSPRTEFKVQGIQKMPMQRL